MQHWSTIKKDTAPGNIQNMVDEMLKSKRASAKQGNDFMTEQRLKEEKEAKLQKRKERKMLKEARLKEESKDSYLSLEQFQYLQTNIEFA